MTTRPPRDLRQEALFEAPEKPSPSHFVEVNEAHLLLYSDRETNEWWVRFRQHFDRGTRITTVVAVFPGDRVRVACQDRQHAEWFRDSMIDKGAPKAALKIGDTR